MSRQRYEISTDRLVVLGSKREWVPMWLWLNVLFRLSLYEIWPISWLAYAPKK